MNELINEELVKLEDELSKLDSVVKQISRAEEVSEEIITAAKTLTSKLETILSSLNNSLDDFIQDEKLQFDANMKIFSDRVNLIKNEIYELTQKYKDQANRVDELILNLKTYIDDLKDINFPQRLDKIDVNITSIVQATQNVQSRIESLESNIKKDIENVDKKISRLDNLTEGYSKNNLKELKKNRLISFIEFLFVIAILIYFYFQFVK